MVSLVGFSFLVSGFLLKSRFLPWKQPETRNQKQETKHTQTISFCVFVLNAGDYRPKNSIIIHFGREMETLTSTILYFLPPMRALTGTTL